MKLIWPQYLIQAIADYLKNRTFNLRYNGATFLTKTATAGVFQGSNISPLLFNIVVKYMPPPKPPQGFSAQYAKETAALYQSGSHRIIQQNLHPHLEEIEGWCVKWRIAINPQKKYKNSVSVKQMKTDDNLYIDGRPIPWRDKSTYLGLVLESKLNFDDHLSATYQKVKASMAGLFPLLNRKSELSNSNKLRLYYSIIWS